MRTRPVLSLLICGLASSAPLAASAADDPSLYRQILDRYDRDKDGRLSDDEAAALRADMAKGPTTASDLAQAVAPENPPTPKPVVACGFDSRFYVRHDDLDLSSYTGLVSKAEAKGASLSAWRDDEGGADQTEIHGLISWVASWCRERPAGRTADDAYLSSRSLAAFVAADGVRSDDPDEDASSLQVGVALQAAIAGGHSFDLQAVTLRPYLQTDFRAQARAAGAALAWEPYRIGWKLGASVGAARSAFYWRAKLDADWLHVDDPGRTELEADTDYLWLGGRVGLVVFPALRAGWARRWRIYGDVDLHRDVRNHVEARMLTIGTSINLDRDGDVALSVERSWGEDRLTMKQQRKTALSLDFKL